MEEEDFIEGLDDDEENIDAENTGKKNQQYYSLDFIPNFYNYLIFTFNHYSSFVFERK